MEIDFKRWAVAGPNDDTGLGRMCIDIVAVLDLGRHLVVPSERFFTRPLVAHRDVLLKKDDPVTRVAELLEGLDGLFVIERTWSPLLLAQAKRLGLKIVAIPMWEWFQPKNPEWALCDLFACPAKHCLETLRTLGFGNAVHLMWTLDLNRLPARTPRSSPQLFIHNAGWIDPDDRKGTRETIRAFERVRDDSIRLLVRAQTDHHLASNDPRIEIQPCNLPDTASLYAEGDVAIQPSKMEGLGFMVLEPICSGLPVITLDAPPMNEFVRHAGLRVRPRWFRRKAFSTQWIKHAYLRLPRMGDLARCIQGTRALDLIGIGQENRRWAEETFARATLVENWRQSLQQHLP